jgi:hypothetical protein
VGNFVVSSFPGPGSLLIGAFTLVVMAIAGWHVLRPPETSRAA